LIPITFFLRNIADMCACSLHGTFVKKHIIYVVILLNQMFH